MESRLLFIHSRLSFNFLLFWSMKYLGSDFGNGLNEQARAGLAAGTEGQSVRRMPSVIHLQKQQRGR
jgi:hypothetical protein